MLRLQLPPKKTVFHSRGAVYGEGAPRGGRFLFFGGGAFTFSRRAAPRNERFFIFEGPSVLTLAFSAPRFFKNFLFGGLHDSPFAVVSVQKTELRFLHCPLSPKSQCIYPKMGFCTDFTKQAVSIFAPKWDSALILRSKPSVHLPQNGILH